MNQTAFSQLIPNVDEQPLVSLESLLAQVGDLKSKNAWTHIIAMCHPLAEKYPEIAADIRAHRLLAETAFALSQLHRFEEAISILRKCLEQDPKYYRYLSALAFNYYNALMADKGREINLGEKRASFFEQADIAFDAAEKTFPENIVDYYRHGMLYHLLCNAKDRKAVPFFLQSIQNWQAMDAEERQARHKDLKNYIKALYHLAKSYLALGEHEKALDSIERCLREDEGTNYEEPVHKFYIAGKAYLQMGNLSEAVKFLRVAANQKTRRPKDYIYEAIARCLLHLGEHDKAREWIERIPPRYRKPYVLRLYAVIQSRLGNHKVAEAQFRDALRHDRQGKHKTLLYWGLSLFDQKKYAEALDLFRRANEERRKSFANEYAEALYRAGCCYRELGNPEKAIDAFKKVLSLDDRHHEAAGALQLLKAPDTKDEINMAESGSDADLCSKEVLNELFS